jgi:5-methyltetrahydropteroyltriglutamate--homocysteine methyltransferase
VKYAELVGRENVLIGNDCGFASQAASREIDPTVGWAKFAALAEGARIATRRLWHRRLTASHPERVRVAPGE